MLIGTCLAPDLATLTNLLRHADPTPSLEQDLLQFVPAQRYRREAQNASALLSVISDMVFTFSLPVEIILTRSTIFPEI